MTILFSTSWKKDSNRWLKAIKESLPGHKILKSSESMNFSKEWSEVDFALVWQPPLGILTRCTNLKAVFNLGAGVDYIINKSDLPHKVPLIRLVDPCLTEGMIEYVTHWVIHLHRNFASYRNLQDLQKWEPGWYPRPKERRVGILGLGVLGGASAKQLCGLGFNVAGWSRSYKKIKGIKSFYGKEQLKDFLQRTEILVCLLPLMPDTKGIICSKTLLNLPKGASLINVARGGHVIDDDLIKILKTDHISKVVLDVFNKEPLPDKHPFWKNSKIIITPHVASLSNPETACDEIVKDIKLIESGKSARYVVDRKAGY